jgi:hypothetical protein
MQWSLTHSSWTTSFDKYALPGKAEDKMVSIIIFSKKTSDRQRLWGNVECKG